MTYSPKPIKVFVRDESKIEEVLKFLWEEGVPFHILGRQALLFPGEESYGKLANAEGGWFDVEQVVEFPEICFADYKTTFKWPANIPDHYEPFRSLPQQQKRPSRR